MKTFLEDTIEDLIETYGELSQLTIILPSKRAGGFLMHYLKQKATQTTFAPTISSIEEFIEKISGLSVIPTTELLFTSYESYLKIKNIKEKESFEFFCGWANTLLGDFNEIDRYLLDTVPFFNYLKAIQDTSHWYLKNEKTPLIEKYLSFWENIAPFYEQLKNTLLTQKKGYQGLVYRKAAEDIELYKNAHPSKKHVFIGFNALNKAEQTIFQELLESNMAKVYWDTDKYFMNNKSHSSGLFLRTYQKQWKYYQNNSFTHIKDHFSAPKKFNYIATQKNISQAKYVGTLLASFSDKKCNQTAIVLADEQLLLPILYALPKNIKKVNITMGITLQKMPLASFFKLLFTIHIKNNTTVYYKDILKIIRHPFYQKMYTTSQEVITSIIKQNKAHYSIQEVLQLSKNNKEKQLFKLLFNIKDSSSITTLQNATKLIEIGIQTPEVHPIDISVIIAIKNIIDEISTLSDKFPYIKTVQNVANLFEELIANQTLDFKGDAYDGLQIMGVLESRVLDFEHVIMTSVNEGILPSGKSTPSFITYDLKKQYNLPGYLEKDAIYAYHFTHLLQRTTTATFIYNTHAEGLTNGEMSRFLMQLEIEKRPNHTFEKQVIAPTISLQSLKKQQIEKTPQIIEKIKQLAKYGYSPSALAVYIKNPVDFYYKYIVGIKELTTVEETIAANTLGTIVHETLEALYTPFLGQFLQIEKLIKLKNKVAKEVEKQLLTYFKGGDYSKGKNLLIFEVAKTYVSKFILLEIGQLQKGNTIELLQLEEKLTIPIDVSTLSFPVSLRGTVDRVDRFNGSLRIIDYKTGKVNNGDVEIVNWDEIITDERYSKAFQILVYATMNFTKKPFKEAAAGIYSFKNLQQGFLPFATKPSARSMKKDTQISDEILLTFKKQLCLLLTEIGNPTTPFIEKETPTYDYF